MSLVRRIDGRPVEIMMLTGAIAAGVTAESVSIIIIPVKKAARKPPRPTMMIHVLDGIRGLCSTKGRAENKCQILSWLWLLAAALGLEAPVTYLSLDPKGRFTVFPADTPQTLVRREYRWKVGILL